jgi:urease accessory protein
VITATPIAASEASQHGLAELTFERRDGRTRLSSLQTRSPLVVQRALYPDERRPDLAHVILANPTAGLLAGDRHVIRVHVGTAARARLTTQAATKVFSMSPGEAEQSISLSVDRGGVLEYVTHAVIPFRLASLQQHVTIETAPGGSLIYGDVLSVGRVQSGERLAFRSIAMEITVRRSSGPELYVESYRLNPGDKALDAPGILGGNKTAAVGTLIVVTDGATPEELCEAVRMVADDSMGYLAAAPLPVGGGIVVKILARSASAAESLLLLAASALPHLPVHAGERAYVPAR